MSHTYPQGAPVAYENQDHIGKPNEPRKCTNCNAKTSLYDGTKDTETGRVYCSELCMEDHTEAEL